MASNIRVSKIANATDSDLDIGASVLGKAFEKDAFTWVCIGHLSFDVLVAFERGVLAAAAKGGLLYYAYDESNTVIGVAAWFQPGHAFLSDKDQGDGGMNELFQGFPPELSAWWTEKFFPQYSEQGKRALGDGYKLEAWHLQMIGVLPQEQRKGIGRSLIKAVEDIAKVEKKPIVLEAATDDNVEKFYKKIGFVVKSSGPVEHPDYQIYNDVNDHFGFKLWILVKEFS